MSNSSVQVPKSSVSSFDMKITRHDFPSDFLWGGATSAYQVEGAFDKDGKTHNIWDMVTLNHPYLIEDGSNACVAIDQYHRYKEDILLMKKLGLESYRFSLSWNRILPGGRLSAGVNREGVKFYNDLIDFCLAQGIEPFVTIFHFDTPQRLEDEYGGFLSSRIVEDFAEFAEVCFFEFGDRVKNWMTMNEMWTYAHHVYVSGFFPPNHGVTTPEIARTLSTSVVEYRQYRRSNAELARQLAESTGDPSTEPYIAGHNMILAHATAVDIYRKKYQVAQQGKIGVVNMSTWYEPYNDTEEDRAAASRAVDFMWGWFTAPIVHGDYPPIMRQNVGKRLPKFTYEQRKLVQGSYDFIGTNYYTTNYATNAPPVPGEPNTYYTDMQAAFRTEKDGVPIGESPGSAWFFIVPRGFYSLLAHIKDEYNDPIIYITENGCSITSDPSKTVTEALKDDVRVNCFQDHLVTLKQAIDYGVQVKGYFLWSAFDNFEWAEGYTVRFGIYYVDYMNGLARYPKNSAIWWMNFLTKNLPQRQKRQTKEVDEFDSVKRLRSGRA